MKLGNWQNSYQRMKTEANISRVSILFCAIAIAALSIKTLVQDQTVIIHPWTLTQTTWVTKDNASQSYKEAWGMALAQMLGNITPGNLEFIEDRISPLLPVDSYDAVMTTLKAESIILKENRITTRFDPTKIVYEKSTEKVFVFGKYYTKAPGIKEKRMDRTYEFLLGLDSYLPQIIALDTYEGEPRTEKKLAEMAKEEKAKREKEKNRN